MKTKKLFLAGVLRLLMVAVCIVGLTACNITVVCPHSWGDWVETQKPTCIEEGVQERTCSICRTVETQKIKVTDHIPQEGGDCTKQILCSTCGEIIAEANESHTGGTATCTQKAICEVCGMEYGEVTGHIPGDDDGDCTTAVYCLLCNEVLIEANVNHIGGVATCTQKAICEVCGMEYGEVTGHIPDSDDGDCTTAVYCLLCKEVLIEANANHIGGIAT